MSEVEKAVMDTWWRRGVEYKLIELDEDTHIGVFEHRHTMRMIKNDYRPCLFREELRYILNTSLQCPCCDMTHQKNVSKQIKSILDNVIEKNPDKITYKVYRYKGLYIFKLNVLGNERVFTYFDKRFYINVLNKNSYHEIMEAELNRHFDNITIITHLDKLKPSINKVIKGR